MVTTLSIATADGQMYACAFLLGGITKQTATGKVGKCYISQLRENQFSLMTDDASHYLHNIAQANKSNQSKVPTPDNDIKSLLLA